MSRLNNFFLIKFVSKNIVSIPVDMVAAATVVVVVVVVVIMVVVIHIDMMDVIVFVCDVVDDTITITVTGDAVATTRMNSVHGKWSRRLRRVRWMILILEHMCRSGGGRQWSMRHGRRRSGESGVGVDFMIMIIIVNINTFSDSCF